MSKLGGNSPSADTDKSNNLTGQPGPAGPTGPTSTVPGPTGPAGADSTVPGPTGPTGPVSTVPGPAGNDGVVQTVVGGTNTTVDATDPANPIVNVSASGGQVDSVAAGTNCTVDATDPVNPIVNAEGQVETIVGGTNTTIDNTDPKNPIINVAASSSPTTTKGDLITRGASADIRLAVGANDNILVADSAEASGMKWEPQTPIDPAPAPLTTKGDVYGYDTEAKRIPVGTNDQVLTADSTAALGLAWKSPAAGSVLLPFAYESQIADAGVSTSGNATKGQWVTIGANNLTVFNVGCGMKMSLGSTYRLFIAKEAVTANEVDVVVATSETLTADASVNMIDEGFCHFVFAASFQLEATERYFFGVQRTDGTTTAQSNVILVNGPAFGSNDFSLVGYRTIALNTIPAPGFDLGETGTNFHMPMHINYTRQATLPALETEVAIGGFISGLIGDSELVLVHIVARAFTLKSGLATSKAYSQVTATANATIDIQKNGSSIGTIDFALGVNAATFTFTSDTAFAAGDRLLFVGQGTADTTLADVSLTINGEL